MDDIEKLLKATIQTKVVEAFNSAPEVIEKLVQAALSKEVDQYGGKPSGYGSEKMPFMEYLVGEEIRRATQAVVREYVEEHKSEIRAKVSQAISSSDFGKPFADRIADLMAESYNWRIDLKLDDKD